MDPTHARWGPHNQFERVRTLVCTIIWVFHITKTKKRVQLVKSGLWKLSPMNILSLFCSENNMMSFVYLKFLLESSSSSFVPRVRFYRPCNLMALTHKILFLSSWTSWAITLHVCLDLGGDACRVLRTSRLLTNGVRFFSFICNQKLDFVSLSLASTCFSWTT